MSGTGGPSALVWRFIELSIGIAAAVLLLRWSYRALQPMLPIVLIVGVLLGLRRLLAWRSQRW